MNNIFRSIQNSRIIIWNGFFHTVKRLQLFSTTNRNLPKIQAISYKPSSLKQCLLTKSPHILKRNSSRTNPCLFNLISKRNIHLNEKKFQSPRTPDLIYFPHIARWLKTKLKFKYLKKMWDPNFSEGAFIYGSTQAVCRISEIIHNNNISELEGLLTTPARIKLVDDMMRKLTRTQREIIQISPKDIKILVPMSVELKNTVTEKNCRIAMRVLALKWYPQRSGYLRLVLVALQSEFLKDYKHGIDQDWNISGFDIMECTVLTESPSNTL